MILQACHLEFRNSLGKIYSRKEAGYIADIIFEHFTGLGALDRMVHSGRVISGQELRGIDQAKSELLNYRPVQYVIGESRFMGLSFRVNEQVLIPRPETAELAEWTIHEIRARDPGPLTIVDLGTGSGCLAVILKKNFPEARVTAIDISRDALSLAGENARMNNAGIIFCLMDMLDPSGYETIPAADILISNPPYITPGEKKDMQRNVLDYEPPGALFVPGDDPLQFYRAIISLAGARLNPGGRIFLEINESFPAEISSLFRQAGYASEIRKDLQGKYRMVMAMKKKES